MTALENCYVLPGSRALLLLPVGISPGSGARPHVSPLSTYPEIVAGSAAVLFIAAVFGRTRFR